MWKVRQAVAIKYGKVKRVGQLGWKVKQLGSKQ
jgi:hypothetical protein